MTLPDLIRLYVLIEGTSSCFPVEIQNSGSKTVYDLKKIIIEDVYFATSEWMKFYP